MTKDLLFRIFVGWIDDQMNPKHFIRTESVVVAEQNSGFDGGARLRASHGVFHRAILLCWGLTLVIALGCREKGPKLDAAAAQAFDSAPAEVKQTWEKALSAVESNDYVQAQTLLSGMTQLPLNEAQIKALGEERSVFGARVMAAAEKNDTAAIQAVKMAQQNRRPR